MNKGFLVALREFNENLRTKTFWIGILAFPVMLILMIFVPRWLEQTKDVRRYAIIDQSGWLLEAIDERADSADSLRLLTYLQDQARIGEPALEKLPSMLRAQAEMLENADAEALQVAAQMSAQAMADPGAMSPEGAVDPGLSDEAIREFAAWMTSESAAAIRELGAGLRREDYERIEIPEGTEDPEEWLREQLKGGGKDLFAYFVIGEDPISNSDGCKYVSNNRTDTDLRSWLSRLASDSVKARRFELEEVDPDVAARIQLPLEFEDRQIDSSGAESEVSDRDILRQWAPVAFVYLLWVSIFSIVQMLLTNTVEEKSNRIIEVLLSSVTPLQLMTGKILGIAATGLTIVLSWVFFFVIGLKFVPGWLGMNDIPDLSILISDPIYLVSFVGYFLLGYMLYAAILVGIGSVCNSIKEAQNLFTPIMVLLFLPLAAMVPVGKDPNGTLATVLSFIPPFTPFVMMNRAAGPPEAWEYLVTTILLVASIAIAFWAAAKIFRIGVLMTGKAPKPTEILRWIRAPVGTVPDVAKVEGLVTDDPAQGN